MFAVVEGFSAGCVYAAHRPVANFSILQIWWVDAPVLGGGIRGKNTRGQFFSRALRARSCCSQIFPSVDH